MSKESSKTSPSSSEDDDVGVIVHDGLELQLSELEQRGMTRHRVRALRKAVVESPTDPVLQRFDPNERADILNRTLTRLLVDADVPPFPFIMSGVQRTIRERKTERSSGKVLLR